METKSQEGMRAPNWPSVSEYNRLKEEFKISRQKNASNLLDESELTNDWLDEEKNVAKDLVLDFMWGVECTSQIFGYTGEQPRLEISYSNGAGTERISNTNTLHTIGYEFLLENTQNLLADNSYKAKVYYEKFNPSNYQYKTEPSILFELMGVEEMAHSFYILTKNITGKAFMGGDLTLEEYLGQDHEYRALYWKTAYAKRYMPDLYEDISRLTRNIRYYRSPAGQAEANGYTYWDDEDDEEEYKYEE